MEKSEPLASYSKLNDVLKDHVNIAEAMSVTEGAERVEITALPMAAVWLTQLRSP